MKKIEYVMAYCNVRVRLGAKGKYNIQLLTETCWLEWFYSKSKKALIKVSTF